MWTLIIVCTLRCDALALPSSVPNLTRESCISAAKELNTRSETWGPRLVGLCAEQTAKTTKELAAILPVEQEKSK